MVFYFGDCDLFQSWCFTPETVHRFNTPHISLECSTDFFHLKIVCIWTDNKHSLLLTIRAYMTVIAPVDIIVNMMEERDFMTT